MINPDKEKGALVIRGNGSNEQRQRWKKGKENLCADSIGSVSGTCVKEQREVNS